MAETIKVNEGMMNRVPVIGSVVQRSQERRRQSARHERLIKSPGVALATAEVADERDSDELLHTTSNPAHWMRRRLRIRDRVADSLARGIAPSAHAVVVSGVITEADHARLQNGDEQPSALLGAERLAPALRRRMEAQQKTSYASGVLVPEIVSIDPIVIKDQPDALDDGVLAQFDASVQRLADEHGVTHEQVGVIGVIGGQLAARKFGRLQPAHLDVAQYDRGVVFLAPEQPNAQEAYWTDVPHLVQK